VAIGLLIKKLNRVRFRNLDDHCIRLRLHRGSKGASPPPERGATLARSLRRPPSGPCGLPLSGEQTRTSMNVNAS